MLFPCARHVILYLVLVQPRICPDMTDSFDKSINFESSRSTVAQC